MKEARFYTACADGVQCRLCPHHCRIKEGGRGICRSRECRDGKLFALSYGRPCALAVDPVEKKPLNRFMPGTFCLSLSCTGCNLSCRWCQNSDISQVAPEEADHYLVSPEEVVDLCLKRGLPSLAYTYTEPFTWWEYMYDIAVLAHEKGLKNILVSAGFVAKEPLRELLPYLEKEQELSICVANLKRATRRYAKRQMTWFRRDDSIHWFNIDELSFDQIQSEASAIIKKELFHE